MHNWLFCRKSEGENDIDRAIKAFGDEELRLLFSYIREWNAKPKHCYVSQFVLFRVFNVFPPTDIVQVFLSPSKDFIQLIM